MNTTVYPGLAVPATPAFARVRERDIWAKHIGMHMAKDAGKIAAATERLDHGLQVDLELLQRATRNQLVNALRMCALYHWSPEVLLDHWAQEVESGT